MARTTILTESQKTEVRELKTKKKISYSALASQYGVSESTIIRICKPDYFKRNLEGHKKYYQKNKKEIIARQEERSRNYYISFHIDNDAEVIAFLDSKDNVTDYFRQCVMKDINMAKADSDSSKEKDSTLSSQTHEKSTGL